MAESWGILVTGAGAPGIAGTAHALRANPAGCPVRLAGADVSPHAVGRHLLEGFGVLPFPEEPGYLDALVELCEDENVKLVLPQTTREIAVLSRARSALEARGITVIVADSAAIERANNKHVVMEAFGELSLPVAAHRLAKTADEVADAARELGYPDQPVVVKPPVSNGMRGFRVLTERPLTRDQFLNTKPEGVELPLDALIAMDLGKEPWPELLVTEYLPGMEYSVDAFLGEAGGVAVPRRRDHIRSGISFRTTVEAREDLSEATLLAGRHLGLRFAFGFQFKLDAEGQPRVLECNPRVQGTMVASALAGVNCIWLAVEEAMGQAPGVEDLCAGKGEFHRYWGGVNEVGQDIRDFNNAA